MIKASNKRTIPSETAYHEKTTEPALGIAFEKTDGTRRFMPYALLSAVEYDGKDELTIHFGFGPIIVRGENLEPLWTAVCQGQLGRVWESEKPSGEGITWVRKLLFADPKPDDSVLPFPAAL